MREADLASSASLSYADCCERYHLGWAGGNGAPTPEALMRSRYSAYALAQPDTPDAQTMLTYLLNTWHSSSTPGDLELFPRQWTGLEVLQADATAEAGVVEFIAHFKENGQAEKLQELSRFVCVQGVWLYLDGAIS
jgi:SEC-C motif domain protein